MTTIEDAAQRGWGPGWPDCHAERCVTVVGGGVRVTVRREISTIVAWLMDESVRRGYVIRDLDTGGFNCRSIRNEGKAPSNHSWGLAVDINWKLNPDSSDGIIHTNIPAWMVDLWEAHGFRWGGHYQHSYHDPMHFEFMLWPADADRIAAELAAGTAPVKVAAQLPLTLRAGTAADPYLTDAPNGTVITTVQQNLNAWVARHHPHGLNALAVNGVYGRATALYVVAFKLWVIDLQTAFHKPVWPNHDTTVGLVTYGALDHWAHN